MWAESAYQSIKLLSIQRAIEAQKQPYMCWT